MQLGFVKAFVTGLYLFLLILIATNFIPIGLKLTQCQTKIQSKCRVVYQLFT